MVPTVFIPLEALPLTPNGKVDRKALPRSASFERSTLTPAGSDMREILTRIWSDVLGLESVGVDQSFFDLGGNSLHAMMIIARISDAFGVEVAIPAFFEQPTISGLAEVVGRSYQTDHQRELAAMLDMVESLSAEEASRLLNEEPED